MPLPLFLDDVPSKHLSGRDFAFLVLSYLPFEHFLFNDDRVSNGFFIATLLRTVCLLSSTYKCSLNLCHDKARHTVRSYLLQSSHSSSDGMKSEASIDTSSSMSSPKVSNTSCFTSMFRFVFTKRGVLFFCDRVASMLRSEPKIALPLLCLPRSLWQHINGSHNSADQKPQRPLRWMLRAPGNTRTCFPNYTTCLLAHLFLHRSSCFLLLPFLNLEYFIGILGTKNVWGTPPEPPLHNLVGWVKKNGAIF